MEIKNKKEINLTKDDVEYVIKKYLCEQEYIGNDNDKFSMDFIVKNEIRPGPYPQDGYDHYVFKGVNVVVTHD